MNASNIGLRLLMIACCFASMPGYAQKDSLTIARSRIVRWVANIDVANEMIEERDVKLDNAANVIRNLQSANELAIVTISDAQAHTKSLAGKLGICEDENTALTKRVRKLTGWATLGKSMVVVGTVVVALFVVKEFVP